MGVLIDDNDLEDIGVKVRDGVSGWKDGFGNTTQFQNLPLNPGGKFLNADRGISSRTITLPLYLEGSDHAEAKNRLDELKFRLNPGSVTVELPDEDREFDARATQVVTSGIQRDFLTVAFNVDVTFQLADPRLYKTTTESIDFSVSATEIPLGSAIVHPKITIEAVDAPYKISLQDPDGVEIDFITLDTILAAGEQRIIDMAQHTIEDSSGNNKIGDKSGGRFFGIDPESGTYGGPYPKLTIDKSPTVAKAEYQKAYI